MNTIVTVSMATLQAATVERDKDWARIRFGNGASVSMTMEALRDLCNDIAEVLDDWFKERDRNGNS